MHKGWRRSPGSLLNYPIACGSHGARMREDVSKWFIRGGWRPPGGCYFNGSKDGRGLGIHEGSGNPVDQQILHVQLSAGRSYESNGIPVSVSRFRGAEVLGMHADQVMACVVCL